ncbi:unnamed protein product [Amoebophrya sp. A25]|nr:unnamed protein product [Amoebophrya sp. A25]|eukprot:GSA25T00003462001.1
MLNCDFFARDPSQVGNGACTQEGFLEILPKRFYWVSLSSMPRQSSQYHFFCIDHELVYEPFYQDFGPLNLSCTYKYSRHVQNLLNDPALSGKKIVHYCSADPKKRANAAYLACAFQVMILRREADVAYKPFVGAKPAFMPFRDATMSVCTYQNTVLDCVRGLEYGMRIKWFDPATFDVQAYDFYEKVEHGDISWVIPDKFLAFSGPSNSPVDGNGYPTFTPEDYVPVFKAANVALVVRLNKKQYDRRRFLDNGLKHADLFFIDGSCPPRDIIIKFLQMVEAEPNAVAVHCKAGLGRTGTLIGLYAQKHYQFPGRAYIGWNRICRPGAILGPQQQFLVDMEREMFQVGEIERANLRKHNSLNAGVFNGIQGALTNGAANGNGSNANNRIPGRELTEEEKREDVGQGDRLVGARLSNQLSNRGSTSGFFGLANKFGGGSSTPMKPSVQIRGMFGPQPLFPGAAAAVGGN